MYAWGSGDASDFHTITVQPNMSDALTSPYAPDCSSTYADTTVEHAWCTQAHRANSAEVVVLDSAFARLKQRGGICATMAYAADSLISLSYADSTKGLRIWSRRPNQSFAGASHSHSNWVLLDSVYLGFANFGAQKDIGGYNLDWLIAHEMDHYLGTLTTGTDSNGHFIRPDGTVDESQTAYSAACSG
jgi:hypothetical protein